MEKWIDDRTRVICPICKEEYSDEIFYMYGRIKHCPNCGVRLHSDFEEEDTNEQS